MRLIRIVTVILVAVAVFTVLGLLIRYCMHRVPMVLAGPIDPSLDTVGPISEGMTRNQLISILGSPLRPRDTRDRGDYFDPVTTDYFSGIYAEVAWTDDNKVAYVFFPLDTFERTYNADLRVVLRLPDRDVVLSRSLNWSSAQHLWKNKKYMPPNLRVVKGDHVIVIEYPGEKYVTLYFSVENGKLQMVHYMFPKDNANKSRE